MGYSGHWVVARGAGRLALRRLGLEPARAKTGAGWRYAYGKGLPDDLDVLVVRAARAGDGTAVGAMVHDGAWSQVVAVDGTRRGAVAVGSDRAGQRLEHDPEWFARWSICAPNRLSAEEIRSITERRDLPAEHTVDELFDRLGLPAPYEPLAGPGPESSAPPASGRAGESPPRRATRESVEASALGGYLAPLGFMREPATVGPGRVPWRELRHVPGLGEGCLGIWDRAAPDVPVATFPVSRRGEAALHDELDALQLPLRIEALRADGLGGFVSPDGSRAEVRIAGRDIAFRDARFVVGQGEGFVGIWDRLHPGQPFERFGSDTSGRETARLRLSELLFEEELSTKQTPGSRIYGAAAHTESSAGGRPAATRGLSRRARFWWAGPSSETDAGARGAWLILEEEPDERWRVVTDHAAGGRFHLYAVGLIGPLDCWGRFRSEEEAKAVVARAGQTVRDWQEVPRQVPPTLIATLRWAERRSRGGHQAGWYERFDWVDGSVLVEGARWLAAVIEEGEASGAVVVGERGHEDEAAAYLFRPDDGPRHVYSLDRVGPLLGMLENYLGDVELGDWVELPDDAPVDLATLGPLALRFVGSR